MKRKPIGVILGAFALEILLVTLLMLAGLFAVSYFEANLIVWDHFAVLAYAAGWDRFWMALYLSSDALLFVILVFLFVEVVLFLARSAAKVVFKAIEKTMNAPQEKALAFVKKITLLTLFRWVKINTVKKGILVYVAVIALMLLSGWIPKLILQNREALVFRAFETKNLYTKIDAPDLSDAIESAVPYNIIISAGVANVHLYSVSQTNEAKLYLLYDEERVLADYVWTIDEVTKSIRVDVNVTQTTYTPYVDLVLPSVELYLPAALKIGDVKIFVETHGSVAIDFLAFESIQVEMKEGELYVRQAKNHLATSAIFKAEHAQMTLQFERVEQLELVLIGTRANVRVGSIDHALIIDAREESDLFLYQVSAETIDVFLADSIVQLREVYAPRIVVESIDSTLTFVNGLSSYPYENVSIDIDGGEANLRGLPDDSQSD